MTPVRIEPEPLPPRILATNRSCAIGARMTSSRLAVLVSGALFYNR